MHHHKTYKYINFQLIRDNRSIIKTVHTHVLAKQDVREAYAQFFPEQECDPVTVLV